MARSSRRTRVRRDWTANPELPPRYQRHRPNVERVISQLASRGGRRLKLRYRGTTTNHAWLKRRTAALNLRKTAAYTTSPAPGP
jgi:hypothetical protein